MLCCVLAARPSALLVFLSGGGLGLCLAVFGGLCYILGRVFFFFIKFEKVITEICIYFRFQGITMTALPQISLNKIDKAT